MKWNSWLGCVLSVNDALNLAKNYWYCEVLSIWTAIITMPWLRYQFYENACSSSDRVISNINTHLITFYTGVPVLCTALTRGWKSFNTVGKPLTAPWGMTIFAACCNMLCRISSRYHQDCSFHESENAPKRKKINSKERPLAATSFYLQIYPYPTWSTRIHVWWKLMLLTKKSGKNANFGHVFFPARLEKWNSPSTPKITTSAKNSISLAIKPQSRKLGFAVERKSKQRYLHWWFLGPKGTSTLFTWFTQGLTVLCFVSDDFQYQVKAILSTNAVNELANRHRVFLDWISCWRAQPQTSTPWLRLRPLLQYLHTLVPVFHIPKLAWLEMNFL